MYHLATKRSEYQSARGENSDMKHSNQKSV